MFLNNITAIDHAYIDDQGRIIGGAISPTMFVSGEVDETEKVVVDFSTVKKSIKHIIDAKYSGFDHKIWIIEGYSNCLVYDFGETNNVIATPLLRIDLPIDAIKMITVPFDGVDYKNSVLIQMERELDAELELMHPGVNISVSVDFDESFIGNPQMDTPMMPFRYTHGLKGSTSWGCQNIAHGHLSYLAAATTKPLETEMLLQKIAADIDGTIFVWEDNLTFTEEAVTVSYTTDRGSFEMIINNDYAAECVVPLTTETTVEFLAEAIANQYRDQFVAAGVTQLFVSEGLNKGAVAEF